MYSNKSKSCNRILIYRRLIRCPDNPTNTHAMGEKRGKWALLTRLSPSLPSCCGAIRVSRRRDTVSQRERTSKAAARQVVVVVVLLVVVVVVSGSLPAG